MEEQEEGNRSTGSNSLSRREREGGGGEGSGIPGEAGFFSSSPRLLPGREGDGVASPPPEGGSGTCDTPSVPMKMMITTNENASFSEVFVTPSGRFSTPPRVSPCCRCNGRPSHELRSSTDPFLLRDAVSAPAGFSSSSSRSSHRHSPNAFHDSKKKVKSTGMYAGDVVPGQYLRTLTGTPRGEELFSRPDLPRPWRSVTQQSNSMAVAVKEREIESLLALCSDLRTQLGNAKSDAQLLEHAVVERMKKQLAAKDERVEEMKRDLKKVKAMEQKAKEDAEHQIRLLQAQHENQLRSLETDARIMSERMIEQAKQFDQQMKDVKEIAAREVQLLETRLNVRAQELEAELKASHAGTASAEKHYQSQLEEMKTLQARIEAAFADHRRNAEEKREDLQKAFDRSLQRERAATCEAQREAREAKERMAAGAVDAEEMRQRFLLWSEWILLMLDAHRQRYAETCPAHVSPISDPRLHEIPPLYTPRCLQQDVDAKVTMERVVLRLLELEAFPIFPEEGGLGQEGRRGELSGEGKELARETEALQIAERQHQLRAGVRELEDRCRDLESTCTALRSRLGFFSDDLGTSTSSPYPQVQPPLPGKCTFVCLAVYEGNLLWARHPSDMQTAMTFLHTTLRTKRQEYGAYECYVDGVCMLLAFEDVIAACRFAVDVQEWCLRLPWPSSLLHEEPSCATVYASAVGGVGPDGYRHNNDNPNPIHRVIAGGEANNSHEGWAGMSHLLGRGEEWDEGGRGGGPPHHPSSSTEETAVDAPPAYKKVGGGETLVFHGLRVGAAIHTGLCGVEDTAVPEWRHTGVRTSHSLGTGSRRPPLPGPSHASSSTGGGQGNGEKEQAEAVGVVGMEQKEGRSPRASKGLYRRHYYGRGVLQTLYIASLAQGGQVLVSDAVWSNPGTRSRLCEISGRVLHRSLGRYAILSLDTKSGLEESQTMELFQLLPVSLAGRRFVPTALLLQHASQSPSLSSAGLSRERRGEAGGAYSHGQQQHPSFPSRLVSSSSPPHHGSYSVSGGAAGSGVGDIANGLVKGLERVKNFTIAVGISSLEHQHRAMEEGLRLLQGELRHVHNKSEEMMEKARKASSQFHLLPPPEMVHQLNDLYGLLEDVAGMTDDISEDMKQVEVAQDELRTNLQGVREYLFRYLSDGERESSLKVEHEAALRQLDRLLREVQAQRQTEIDRLQLALNERDQALQRIFQQRQQMMAPQLFASPSTSSAPSPSSSPLHSAQVPQYRV